jgi:hypothetical protein
MIRRVILPVAGVLLAFLAFRCFENSRSPQPAGLRPPAAAPAPLAKAPDFAVVENFASWSQHYLAASDVEKPALLAAGVALAEKRRPIFKELIIRDPERALEQAVPRVVRQQLPPAVVALLEQPVSAKGRFNAYFAKSQSGAALPEMAVRYFEVGDMSFRARVFGAWLNYNSKQEVAIRGVAVDRELAVAQSPLRELERGESIPLGTKVTETCPISGETTPVDTATAPLVVNDETPVVEVGGEYIKLCNGAHVRVYDDRVSSSNAMASGPGGAGFFRDNFPGTSAEAIGNFKALYIRVTYPDQNRSPNTEAEAIKDMDDVQKFFLQNSFGKLTTTTTVTPLVVLPQTKEWYIAKDDDIDGLGMVHSDSRSAARRLGYDSNQFNVTIVRVNGGPRLSGISWGGGDSVWLSWNGMDVINHEAGHSLGRNHANFWDTNGTSVIGDGVNEEYGNGFDVMGGGAGFSAHYNTVSKRELGWLPDAYIHRPAANGTYRIFSYDQPFLQEQQRYAVRYTKDARRTYHVEYHPQYGIEHNGSAALKNSAVLITRWSDKSNCGHLVDITPNSEGGKSDGGIAVGQTFSDREADLHFTTLARNDTQPQSLDINVQKGPFPGNQPPTLALAASAVQVAVGGSITFTATATDPNGDALAYHWEFEDGYESQNSATLTRAFGATNQMTVHCTASDMKGGTARRHVVVTVGNPGRIVMNGRVLAAGTPLQSVYIRSDSGKYTYTDSDGYFALSDLSAGNRTLEPFLEGYEFVADFTNPYALAAAGFTGANFTANSLPELQITANGTVVENGSAANFTISRTGDSTDALTVRVTSATGTAIRGTDYSFAPNYVDNGSFREFTIPAGAAALQVNVNPTNDNAAEGPETIILQLAAIPGHIIRQGTAMLTLNDDDTTLPLVTVLMPQDQAAEGGADGSFLISRTGTTTSPLNVEVAFSGTATVGADTMLSTALTIPAGQSSLTIPVQAINDSATEGTESLTLTIVSKPAYVRDPSRLEAAMTFLDDDMPMVSVTAPDNEAKEAGREPAVFLFNRTGPITAPLKVYYGLRGSASHGHDYLALKGEVVIHAGERQAAVVITPYDDAHGEGDETVTMQLANFDGTYSSAEPFSATVTIRDNADKPLVTVDSNSSTIGEPNDTGVFTFTARGSHTTPTTVRYTVGGTATAGQDYTALSGTVVIPAPTNGVASVDVTITPMNDAVHENVETIILTVSADPAYIVYNDTSAMAWLRDDEKPTVNLSVNRGDAGNPGEPAVNGSFSIGRSNAAAAAVTAGSLVVNYQVSGSATGGADYALLTGSVTIPDTASLVDIPITIINDTLVEGVETVTLTLLDSADYSVGVRSTSIVLTDDEAEPADSAVRSIGFQATTSSTTEAPDATTAEYRFVPVTLSAAHLTADVTAEVIISSGSSAFGDDVDFALVDPTTNASVLRTTVTFPAGSVAVQEVKIRVLNDGIVEVPETIALELVNATNARLSSSRAKHTMTLADNALANPTPRVSFVTAQTTRVESDGTEPLLIAALDQPLTTNFTVNYAVAGGTAGLGGDFSLNPGTLTFAPGETAKLISLSLVNDSTEEPTENVVVSLLNPSAAAVLGTISQQNIIITDDDQPTIAILSPSAFPAIVPTGNGLILQASVLQGGQVGSGSWTQVSGPGAAVLGTPGLLSTSVTFPTAGSYVFRMTTGLATTAEVRVEYGDLQGRQIGTTTAAGSFSLAGNTYTVRGAGSGLSSTGTADGFYFLSLPLSGDFDIRCRVLSAVNPGNSNSCRFGLMARADNTAGSSYAMSLHRITRVFDLNVRSTASGATTAQIDATVHTWPRWVRLVRVGDTIRSFLADGNLTGSNIVWTQRGVDTTVALGGTPLVGFAITSAAVATASTVTFDNLSLNIGPRVNAGGDIAAAPYNLSGSVVDDAFPNLSPSAEWTKVSGPGSINFAAPLALATAATFTQSGMHTARLTATDGGMTTFDDVNINAVAMLTPIESWRNAQFGANAAVTAIAGDTADPDGDGVSNLLEYALGTNPQQRTAGPALASPNSGALEVIYQRNTAATDVTLQWETATALVGWGTTAPTTTLLSTNGNVQTLRATLPISGNRRFYRLAATR